ncbi:MAG TPA: SDR family NAD(P)-dependent oxidoreductase [Acidimicrobiales bacterium]|jgi:decaprenylphospho-beta-D-erythro-pentofuranosid-2-ulose 2-reductase|nr:SDR family NAD(P)-dependent oxidoreductase [Acidimicrobiales bacterium]
MMDAFGLPQSVVVFGGTSDIASAILAELVPRGCHTVVLAGRDDARLSEVAAAVSGLGATRVVPVQFDATDVAGATLVASRCLTAAEGPVDLILMAVGELGEQLADEVDAGRVAEMITVNYTWPTAVLAVCAQHLRTQGSGRLVVLSSVAGVRVRRANYLYGSAKAGLDAFCAGLAESLRGTGAQLQTVRPGFVRSKMTEGLRSAPFARDPSDVAAAVLKGLETGQPVVWAPPVLRWVFLGLRHLPATLWRRLPG